MQHKCKITVLETKVFPDLQEKYLANPQSGSIMKSWTNDDRMMIACCNDGTRPVVFKIERIDVPETDEEAEWLARQDFTNGKDDAYTG